MCTNLFVFSGKEVVHMSPPWFRLVLSGQLAMVLLVGAPAVAKVPPEDAVKPGSSPTDMLQVETVSGRSVAAGQVLVRYRDGAKAGRLSSQGNAVAIGAPELWLYRLQSQGVSTAAMLQGLRQSPDVLYAEPNYIVHTTAAPNDPRFGELWGLQNTGQTVAGQVGTPGADIDAVPAWAFTTGSTSNVAGVVDTGIGYNHPDLAANMWSAGSAFTVTIGGQAITCPAGSHGFNAITNSCDPLDDHGHGTHVAGTIGAKGGNAQGMTGVNQTASIMGLKFLGSNGSGTYADAIDAIEFAIQVKQQGIANIRVLNNSWGGTAFSQALIDQIGKAGSNGILFTAAAGNNGSNNDSTPFYPANFNVSNVVAVAATDNRDAKASFSNYGASTVHLGAPGVSVLSTIRNTVQFCNPVCVPEHDYRSLSGTSMATPHVTGAALLSLAACPQLTMAGLKSALLSNVDPVASMAGTTTTGGRLNALRTIQSCSGPFYVNSSPTFRSVGRARTTTYAITVGVNNFGGTVNLSVTGLPAGTTARFSPASVTGGGTATMTVTTGASTPLGTYTLSVKGTSGTITSTSTVTLEVALPNFTIAAGPATQLVNPGKGVTYNVTLGAAGSFASPVGLSLTGLPAGATASFSPGSLTPPGSSTLSITTSSTAPEGTYTLTIKGTGGGLIRTTTVTLDIRRPTFTFTATPTALSIKRGLFGNLQLWVTSQYGFTGTVSFTIAGLCPDCKWSNPTPVAISPGSPTGYRLSQLTTKSTTPIGTYTLTVTATSSGVTKTLTVPLTVTA